MIIHAFATKQHGKERKFHIIMTIPENEEEVKHYGKINAPYGLEQLEHIWRKYQ